MTCKELAGACNLKFSGETFKEIEEQSKTHGMEMVEKGDLAHIEAMNKMTEIMKDEEKMKKWMIEYERLKQQFKELPVDN